MTSNYRFKHITLCTLSMWFVGCPVEPLPPDTFCGELCQSARDNPPGRDMPEDLVVTPPDATMDLVDMPSSQPITCTITLAQEDLTVTSSSPQVMVEASSSFINLTALAGTSTTLTFLGADPTRPLAEWSTEVTITQSCTGLDDFMPWSGVGLALAPPEPFTGPAPEVRTRFVRDTGQMWMQVGELGWRGVVADRSSDVKLLSLSHSILDELGPTANLSVSPDGRALVASAQSRMVFFRVDPGQPLDPRLDTGLTGNVATVKWSTNPLTAHLLTTNSEAFALRLDDTDMPGVSPDPGTPGFEAFDVIEGHTWAILNGGNIRHYNPDGERLSAQRGPSEARAIFSDPMQDHLIILTSSTDCTPIEQACHGELVRANGLVPVQDEMMTPMTFDEVIGVMRSPSGFDLLTQESSGVAITRVDTTQTPPVLTRIEDAALQDGTWSRPRSQITPRGAVLIYGGLYALVYSATTGTLTRHNGPWEVEHITAEGSVELISRAASQAPRFFAERLVLSASLDQVLDQSDGPKIGANFDYSVGASAVNRRQTLELNTSPGFYRLGDAPRVEPLPTPSGAPCLLYRQSATTTTDLGPLTDLFICGTRP